MKKLIALLFGCVLLFTGCGALVKPADSTSSQPSVSVEELESSFIEPEDSESVDSSPESSESEDSENEDSAPESSESEDSENEDSAPESSESEDSENEDSAPESCEPEDSENEDSAPESSESEDSESGESAPESSEPEDSEDSEDSETEEEHNYTATVTLPTCENGGYTTYTCTGCGISYTSNYVNALGHSYNATVTAPTCESGGHTTYTCTGCGISYISNYVNALGHSYKAMVTAPTCESGGYTTYTCAECRDTYVDNELDALGHSWKEATTEAPKTCIRCWITVGDKLPTPTNPTDILSVNYVDVGQGDCIFIQVDDCDILIDAGKPAQGTVVSNYLKSKGVDDIELMINTHLDDDHYGGLTQVLTDFEVEEIWGTPYQKSNDSITTFKNAVSREGLTIKNPSVGTIYSYEYLTLTVLYDGVGASNSNNSSLVVMLQYGSVRFLFTGDIGEATENKLVNNSNINLSCDVLKVGHHGSATSSTKAFLSATKAKYGVICVGAGNSYGHPKEATLSRLKTAGIAVYRTDQNGHVVFTTDGTKLTLPGNGGTVNGTFSSGSSSGSSTSSSSTDTFIGNKESKIFHLPTCGNLPDVSKRNYLYNYWFIVNCIGYTPCKVCLKNYVP